MRGGVGAADRNRPPLPGSLCPVFYKENRAVSFGEKASALFDRFARVARQAADLWIAAQSAGLLNARIIGRAEISLNVSGLGARSPRGPTCALIAVADEDPRSLLLPPMSSARQIPS